MCIPSRSQGLYEPRSSHVETGGTEQHPLRCQQCQEIKTPVRGTPETEGGGSKECSTHGRPALPCDTPCSKVVFISLIFMWQMLNLFWIMTPWIIKLFWFFRLLKHMCLISFLMSSEQSFEFDFYFFNEKDCPSTTTKMNSEMKRNSMAHRNCIFSLHCGKHQTFWVRCISPH